MHIGIDGLLLHGAFSGVEQAIFRLVRELSRDGGSHRYTLYAPRDFAVEGLDRPGFEVRRLGFEGGARLRRILWTHAALGRRASADGVRLLHGPGYILPRGWRGPAVVTVYDVIALTHPELCARANALYYRACLPATIARADAVIVPSLAVKHAIIERLQAPEAKLHVAPLGVGEEFLAPVSPEQIEAVRHRHALEGPYLLCVGNLEPKKNLAATIAAVRQARQTCALPHSLVLAGAKAWRSESIREAMAQAGANVVREVGHVTPADLPALYAGAEALLFWSLVEGFGLPALEAMACGTPVICSDRGALPEVVGEAGVVVPIGEPALLAEAIAALAGDRARRAQMVEHGRRRASRFTWRAHAEAVLAVYREVGDGRG